MMNCNADPLTSIVIHLLLILTMASSLTHHQVPVHTARTSHHVGATPISKPSVWEREQQILTVYHSTIAQVTQTSAKIAEINRQVVNHSLDLVATNVLRFDEYIADVDAKTKHCKFNNEAQIQRIKDLLQQKLKTRIGHCMARVSNRLGTFEKSVKDELNRFNNVILLQIKNILLICNRMHGDVMHLCLDKSWQICMHVNDKLLTAVNGYFGHALLVYNQSNGVLLDCLQKDVQVNKKYYHWVIKLYRTSACKNLLNS